MKIYSHRGLTKIYPENSKAAVLQAINKGFYVEVDTRFTKDNRIVVIHDANLLRNFAIDVEISQATYQELLKLGINSKPEENLPLLQDLAAFVFKNNANTGFAIHFKQEQQNYRHCLWLAELFRKYKLYDTSFIFNLSLESCKIFREIDPKIKLGILVSDTKFEPFVYLWQELSKDKLKLFDVVWSAEYESLYNEDFFREIKSNGKQVLAVSYELQRELNHPLAQDYRKGWEKFLQSAIDGVCTDYPEEFKKFLSSTEKNVIV